MSVNGAKTMKLQDRLFTFTYYSNQPAMENDFSDYIDDYIIVKAYSEKHTKPRQHTDEYNKASREGFVFCKWINHYDMLMVRPSDAVKEKASKIYGYRISDMVVNKCVDGTFRLVATLPTDSGGGFSHHGIVGDLNEDGKKLMQSILNREI